MMLGHLKRFSRSDSGAVTVDWVVLTAAGIGLGMIVLIPFAYSTDSLAQDVAMFVSEVPVGDQ